MIAFRGADRRAVLQAAVACAQSDLSDYEARNKLRQVTLARSRGVQGALRLLSADRRQFDDDRAYRLLEAAAADADVQPISPEFIDLFAREEELGRMPVEDAYARLTELQPELATSGVASNGRPLSSLLGPGVPHPDALVRSQLTLSIAGHYRAILAGELPGGGDLRTSYFAAPVKKVIRTTSFDGGAR